MINSFSNSSAVRFVEDILAGLANVSLYDNINWDSDNMFLRFKDYVVAEEEELEKRMRGVTYYIEDTSTLELISGGARPEKVWSVFICFAYADGLSAPASTALFASQTESANPH
jgi:hypothetical protein